MKRTRVDSAFGLKDIDNSQVVRERDPRSSRDIWLLLSLVAVLVGGMVLYAWPHFERRQLGLEREALQHEKERLLEQHRKLGLEKATLESLERIESIATRELGLQAPNPQDVVVVEPASALPSGALIAQQHEGVEVRRQ